MIKKVLLFLILTLTVTVLALTLWAIPRLPEIAGNLANRAAKEYFDESIKIEKASFTRDLKIHLEGITGKLKTRKEPVALEIKSLRSEDSLLLLICQEPIHFTFEGVRPQGSSNDGISGTLMIQTSGSPRFEATVDFGKTGLEDWQWLNPENLEGATGATKGTLTFRQITGKDPEFSMNLEAPEPGGNIQARFFDLFLPYLPTSLQKEKVLKVSQSQKLIRYQTASLEASLPRSDRLKILLRIFIPDYNLKLTLNADIRTDAKDAFAQIARLMGLIA